MGVKLVAPKLARTQQPSGPIQASAWARSRGIGSLLLPSAGLRDIVDGGQWTSWGTAPTIGTGRHGVCIDSTAAFGGLLLTPKVNQATAAQTHIILVDVVAISGGYAGLVTTASADGGSGSCGAQQAFDGSAWGTRSTIFATWSPSVASAFGPSLLVITGDSTGTTTYLDGAVVDTTAGAPVAQSDSRLVLGGERAASAGAATKMRTYLYAHLAQRISTAEVAALNANLWGALLAPMPRRIWVPSAGGGTDATVALTGATGTFVAGTTTAAGTGNATVALTGTTGAFAAGTTTAGGGASIALVGTSRTFTAGTVTATAGGNATVALVGAPSAFAAGAITAAAGASIALVGTSGTFTAGTVGASTGTDVTTALTGVGRTFAAGTIGATGAAVAAITGAACSFAAGVVSAVGQASATVALIGARATFTAGVISGFIPSGISKLGGDDAPPEPPKRKVRLHIADKEDQILLELALILHLKGLLQ